MGSDRKYRLDCAVDVAMSVIEGKWKSTILCKLCVKGDLRFNELRNEIPAVSAKVLINQLRELEIDGLVRRIESNEGVSVTYSITEKGQKLMPALRELAIWAIQNMNMNAVKIDLGDDLTVP